MSKSLWQLFAIFICSFATFAATSLYEFEWSLGDHEFALADATLLQAAIQPFQHQQGTVDKGVRTTSPAAAAKDKTSQAPKVNQPAPVLDKKPKRILLIGDSMAEGLMVRLLDYAKTNKHTLKTVTWYGSSTRQYAHSDTLGHYVREFKPDIVFVSLGTNEWKIPYIGKKHEDYVRKIVGQIDSLPFLWIGPPNPEEDTGINAMIEGIIGSSRFYHSNKLVLERQKDGMHPTRSNFAIWADSLAKWIQDSSSHRIVMQVPTKSTYVPKPDLVVLRQK